ncbi:uncharacterized protein LOC127866466 isoform X4 [Dreissena polymorpha]|uniref:uncharacterized protein LOC127866466 isoform X4 n=1 Tax=Dreissena polymorpha TaxID=45954 RepID=UPI002264CE6C|nr:uncharacterized protein LOC127866466 isoform X4 [Dreissena polymorpha]
MLVTEAAEQQRRPEVGRLNQLGSAAQFCLKVQVGDVMVDAVIDSAAEVSLISDRVYKAMKQPPPKQRDVKLLMTGRDASMQGFVVGPVKLKIGNNWYQQHLYVAPTDVDMLLGFDILMNPGRAIINMAEATIIFDGQVLSLEGGSLQHTDHVHDAAPFALPTASEVVRDPQMVTDESTERDHGGSSYVGTFRVQRMAVQSGDRATPTAGHADPAGVTAEDSREKASSCGVTAADRRKRASGYGVTSEVRWNSACGYRVSTSNIKLPTVQEVVRHIGVCTDESTEGGNGKTGGVGGREDEFTEGIDDAVPLQLPTVCENVRHIGVCTDISTVRGNGETGGVGDGEATAEGENSCKPYSVQQGSSRFVYFIFIFCYAWLRHRCCGVFTFPFPFSMDTSEIVPIAALEESSSYGDSVGIVLTELPKRPAGIVPQELSSFRNTSEESSSYWNSVDIVHTELPKRPAGIVPQELSCFRNTSEELSSYENSVGIVLTELPKRPAGIVPQELSSFRNTSEESSSYGNSVGIVLTELPKRPAGIVPQELSSFRNTSEESSSYGNSVGIVLTELSKRPAGIVPQELSSFRNTSEESSSYGNSVGIVLTELPKRPAGIVPQELSSFRSTSEESSSYGNPVGIVLTGLPKRPVGIDPRGSFRRGSEGWRPSSSRRWERS